MADDSTQITLQLILEPISGPSLRDPVPGVSQQGVIVAGRTSGTHYRFPKDDPAYSRLHFMVELNAPDCYVVDLGSRKGTYVNRMKIAFREKLKDGDSVRAGKTKFRVHLGDPIELEQRALNRTAVEVDRSDDDDTSVLKKVRLKETEEERKARKLKDKKRKLAKLKQAKLKARAKAKSQMLSDLETDAKKLRTPQTTDSDFDIDRLLEGDTADHSTNHEPLPETDDHGPPKIPGFEIIRSLGKGTIGEVFLCSREPGELECAIKVIRTSRWNDRAAVDPFLKDLNPYLQLEHTNIVRYHEFGVAPGFVYIVMDYVEGKNTEEIVREGGAMAITRVAKAGSQLLLGLDYAHTLGFVHRDIKPSNLIITEAGGREVAMFADFGLTRAFQNSPLCGLKMKVDMEKSVRFMAPEIFQNFKDLPTAVDIYSMAATFYYLLSTKYTQDFESMSFDQAVNKIKRDDAVNLNRRRMDVPGELANLIHLGLNRFPMKRIPSAAAFRKELYKFIK